MRDEVRMNQKTQDGVELAGVNNFDKPPGCGEKIGQPPGIQRVNLDAAHSELISDRPGAFQRDDFHKRER